MPAIFKPAGPEQEDPEVVEAMADEAAEALAA
jgi:hypothetical protein